MVVVRGEGVAVAVLAEVLAAVVAAAVEVATAVVMVVAMVMVVMDGWSAITSYRSAPTCRKSRKMPSTHRREPTGIGRMLNSGNGLPT